MRSIKFTRGDSWQMAWIIKDANMNPIDLSGASARVHIRDRNGKLMIEASTSNQKLFINPLEGRIDMLIPFSETNIQADKYVFDLEVTHSNNVRVTYDRGELVVVQDVTH